MLARLLCAAILAGTLLAPPAGTTGTAVATQETRSPSFDQLQGVPPLAPAELLAAMPSVAELVLGEGDGPRLPFEDDRPRIVFLSVSDGQAPARVEMGAGHGFAPAVADAAARLGSTRPASLQARWLKVDVVADVAPIDQAGLSGPLPLDPTLEGLVLGGRDVVALLPEELVSNALVNSERKVQVSRIGPYLESSRASQSRAFLSPDGPRPRPRFRFTTVSAFTDGDQYLPLYRGHRHFDEFSPEELLEAARSAGRYLVRATGPDGRFIYKYEPALDAEVPEYNLLRHAGTLYSMLELYQQTGDSQLLEASDRALAYLLKTLEPCRAGDLPATCAQELGFVKLGGNGLAIIALAKHAEVTGDRQHVPLMQALARWIQGVQDPAGQFTIHKLGLRTGTVAPLVSEYYPGEALLALLRLNALDQDPNWLDVAERGARWLIQVRDGGLADHQLAHDHWLLYALNELYRVRPDPLYLDHAMRIAGAIVMSQRVDHEQPDWAGSYRSGPADELPRSTPAATRSEGLLAAYLLARDYVGPDSAAPIMEAIRRGTAFQLRNQLRPESVMHLPDPSQALGAFKRGLYDAESRIDYAQHSISSLLALYRLTAQ
jgi:hypothetical protein